MLIQIHLRRQAIRSFSLAGGCAITVPPWNVPRRQRLVLPVRQAGRPARSVGKFFRKNLRQCKASVRPAGTRMLCGIVRYVPSGWRRGAAS
jgi:hypothetical protein